MPRIAEILGIQIDAVTMGQAVARVAEMVDAGGFHHVVTPNPEMLLMARRDEEFRAVLNQADLKIPDGVGLKIVGRLAERVSGVDLFGRLVEEGESRGWKFYLLGGQKGVAERARKILQQKHPNLQIVGAESGGGVGEGGRGDQDGAVIERINQSQTDILLVCFGAPKQDFWIENNSRRFRSVKVAIGGGGTLDFIAGTQTRAPLLVRELALEWLWRLITQPKRWKRIWNAVVVFPLAMAKEKLNQARGGSPE